MRLDVLDHGHGIGTKALFAIIRLASGHPVLDVIKMVKYHASFYGDPMKSVTHEAMRGPSAWSVGDRELMAALVANANSCPWCTRAHTAVATSAYGDRAKVVAAVTDLEGAPIDEPLRATLRMLVKLTREGTVDEADMRRVLDAGVSAEQVEDALAVCFAFGVTARLANAFGFTEPSQDAFDAGAKYLLARGYR